MHKKLISVTKNKVKTTNLVRKPTQCFTKNNFLARGFSQKKNFSLKVNNNIKVMPSVHQPSKLTLLPLAKPPISPMHFHTPAKRFNAPRLALSKLAPQALKSNNFLLYSQTPIFTIHQQRYKYGERVLEHFEKSLDPKTQKQNVRSMNKADPTVGTGWVGAPACGDVMKLQIKVNPDTGKIEDACFKTFGCGSAVASSSVVSEMVKEKTIDEALQIKNSIIAEHLSLPPVKLHCSMLAEDAIKAAIKDYKKKNEGKV